LSRVAIIGTGMWAPRLAAVAGRAGLRIVTCYSRNETRRREFSERFSCDAAASFEDAIDHPGVEAAIIATPNDVHAEQTIACARRGVHVFVEKPIADSVGAGEEVRAACAEAGVVLMVGHAFRRLGAARRAKELVDAGALGRVVAHVHTDAEIDDVGVVTLEFESGALAAVTGSYVSPKSFSLRLFGTDAALDYRTDMSIWPNAPEMDAATTLTLGGEAVEFEPRDMLADELAEFADCIRDGSDPETGADEGIAALRAVLDAVPDHQPA
jgi:predicted dehydrogenase